MRTKTKVKDFFIRTWEKTPDVLIMMRREPKWLSKLVKQRKNEISKRQIGKRKIYLFNNLYYPSLKSFTLIIFLLIFVYFISIYIDDFIFYLVETINRITPFTLPNIQDIKPQNNYQQNLMSILGGIGAIVFALSIFVAESFRDSKSDKGRVLLKVSLIWPLVIFLIFSFFILILWGLNTFTVIPVVIVALWSIWSFGRVIIVSLSKYELFRERKEFLKDLMRGRVDSTVTERLSENILMSSLEGKPIKLKYYPLPMDDEDKYICLKADNSGKIKDINMKKLKEFSDYLDKIAKRNGYGFNEEEEKISQDSSTESYSSNESGTRKKKKNDLRYMSIKVNDQVDSENNTLICFDSDLTKDAQKWEIKKLESFITQIFKISKRKDISAEKVGIELSNIKDQLTDAIQNQHTSETSRISEIYVELGTEFSEQLTQYGAFDYEQAKKERASFFSGWREVQVIITDLRDLTEQAIKTNNTEIIRTVIYIPIEISKRALQIKDHYTFQQFISFTELLYAFTQKKEWADENTRKFITERIGIYLKEIYEFYVEFPQRKSGLSVEDIEGYKDFSVHFIFIFQGLMIQSIKNKDYQSFNAFKNKLIKLLDSSYRDRDLENVEIMNLQLEQPDLSEKDKKKILRKIDIKKAKDKSLKEVSDRKNQMLFGIATYALNILDKNKDDEVLKKIFNDIHNSLPNKLEDLTKIFNQSHTFEAEDFWGWNWWDLKIDEGVQTIQILEKLEKFYAIKSLMILAKKTEKEINSIKIPESRDLVHLAEGSRDLKKIIEDIKNNPQNWGFILNENMTSKADSFIKLLEEAKDRQENKEIEDKKKRPLSIKKVKEFNKSVISRYREQERMKTFFVNLGLHKDKSDDQPNPEDKNRLGINIVDDKSAFFENWYVHFGDWGENYGRDMATGVDSDILKQIQDKCSNLEYKNMDSTIDNFGDAEDIFIVSTTQATVRFLDKDNFIPHWQIQESELPKIKGFYGWYLVNKKKIPIVETYSRLEDKSLLILNKSKLGKLIQLPPTSDKKELGMGKRIKEFYIGINSFSENSELLDEFLKKPTDWLLEIGDTEKQKHHLLQRVLIKIFVKYKIEWNENFEGYKVKIEE